jgi:hypothetical protein
MTTSETSLACNFGAIPEDERDRHTEVATNLFESIAAVEELSEGYAFRLPSEPSVLAQAGEFIARERLCCPFFQFDLEVEANQGPVRLTLTGDASVKQYIEDTVLTEWDL